MGNYTDQMIRLAAALGMPPVEENSSIDALLPYLEKMRSEGAVIVLKLDGQRGKDASAYTAVVSNGGLGEEYFRTDAATLFDVACFIIINYAHQCWGFE